jgi:hypothetical protein
MNFWQEVLLRVKSLRLYLIAVGLFCVVLLLLETSGLLPKRQMAPVAESALQTVDTSRLNVSRFTEFLGVASTSTASTTKIVLVTLPVQEKDLLSVGDVLLIPGGNYGVVLRKNENLDSVLAAVEFEIAVEDNSLETGDTITLYR